MLILFSILFGISRGIKEGMVMIRCDDPMSNSILLFETGVRFHKWFKYYHFLSVLPFIFYTILIYLFINDLPSVVLMAGLFCLGWECFELGYNYSRYKTLVIAHENMDFLIYSFSVNSRRVYMIHIARLLTAIILLTIGGKL